MATFGIILMLKRLSEEMVAYVHGSPIDSDTLSICKTSGTHDRLDLSFGFPSEFSVPSLPKHKIYFQVQTYGLLTKPEVKMAGY